MIHIKVNMGYLNVFMLTAEGHANAERNEDGRDLVCCAVATIFGTLANSCKRLSYVETEYISQSGYGCVKVTGLDHSTEDEWQQINARFQMAVDGLEAMAVQYPQCLWIAGKN